MTENATALACMMAAKPVTAAIMCGTIPSVHANAATRLARQPREIPAATVYSTPAPGVATTISVVSRNSGVTVVSPLLACAANRSCGGTPDDFRPGHGPAAA